MIPVECVGCFGVGSCCGAFPGCGEEFVNVSVGFLGATVRAEVVEFCCGRVNDVCPGAWGGVGCGEFFAVGGPTGVVRFPVGVFGVVFEVERFCGGGGLVTVGADEGEWVFVGRACADVQWGADGCAGAEDCF